MQEVEMREDIKQKLKKFIQQEQDNARQYGRDTLDEEAHERVRKHAKALMGAAYKTDVQRVIHHPGVKRLRFRK